MFKWIEKHKGIVIAALLFFIAGVPLIIHILFKMNSGIPFLEAEWTAGDALGYYGSILSFIGTVVLGALALYQNRLIKDESDKRATLLEHKEHERYMPKFETNSRGCMGSCAKLHFSIKNISDNSSTEICLYDIKILSPDHRVHWEYDGTYQFGTIPAKDKREVTLNNPSLSGDGYIFELRMSCKDIYNDIHNYIITGTYYAKNHYPQLKITEL